MTLFFHSTVNAGLQFSLQRKFNDETAAKVPAMFQMIHPRAVTSPPKTRGNLRLVPNTAPLCPPDKPHLLFTDKAGLCNAYPVAEGLCLIAPGLPPSSIMKRRQRERTC